MVVQHNMQAANASRVLNVTANQQAKSTEKLSSGYRINRAADDAAGLAISEKMRSQVRGLDRAATNAQDGVSVVQTAEGALSTVHSMLQRMNELATQAANDTNTTTDRDKIKDEMDQLTSEIDRVQSTTTFNTQKLLTGEFSGKKLQVGAQKGQTISISISNMNASSLGVGSLTVSDNAAAGESMSKVQEAIDTVSKTRSKLGAIQNRLEYTIDNLNTTSENTQAAESRIRDTDMAKEMVSFSKDNILAQAGQSMLSQANQSTQGVLSLLQ
jgi:flagellin